MALHTSTSVPGGATLLSDMESSSCDSSSSLSVKSSLDSASDISSVVPPSFSPLSSDYNSSTSDEQEDIPQEGKM